MNGFTVTAVARAYRSFIMNDYTTAKSTGAACFHFGSLRGWGKLC